MKFLFFLTVFVFTSSFAIAQLPDAPEARPAHVKRLILANLTMYGATVFHGFGSRAEVNACISEAGGLQNGAYASGVYAGVRPASQARFYSIALSIDSAVTTFSIFAHQKKWHGLELVAPFSAAAAHISAGTMKFTNGCY